MPCLLTDVLAASRDRGQPLPLTRKSPLRSSVTRHILINIAVGVGQVIKGWDQGLQGMCLNEKRILTIPSTMAYGS